MCAHVNVCVSVVADWVVVVVVRVVVLETVVLVDDVVVYPGMCRHPQTHCPLASMTV